MQAWTQHMKLGPHLDVHQNLSSFFFQQHHLPGSLMLSHCPLLHSSVLCRRRISGVSHCHLANFHPSFPYFLLFFFFFLILPTQLSMGTKFPLAGPQPGAKNLKELENQNKGGMWYMRHKICRKEKCLAESGFSQPAK